MVSHKPQYKNLLAKLGAILALISFCQFANAASLQSIHYQTLQGDSLQIQMKFDGAVNKPTEFTTDNPARLVLTFDDTKSALTKKTEQIGIGVANSITAIEAGSRMRVVVNLAQKVAYQSNVDGNVVTLIIGEASREVSSSGKLSQSPLKTAKSRASGKVSLVDFRRGEQGEARILVNLSNPDIAIDLKQEGKKVFAHISNAEVADELIRKLDVVDFGTPAKSVNTTRSGNDVRIEIDTMDDFEYLAYQADNLFTVELKPLTKEEKEELAKKKFEYTGKPITLTFQNATIRQLLQIFADVSGLNMVTSDSVQGNLTVRLDNVPWDQALDIILQTKGLDKRKVGNVMWIAPASEIAEKEAAELESQQKAQELAPLRTEYIQINYAKASELAGLMKSEDNSLLSERGSVSVDERTNMLLVQDTSDKLEEIRSLILQLDVPIRQVLIEARIVTATDGFKEELGVRFGVNDRNSQSAFGGTIDAATQQREGRVFPTGSDRLNVDLPASNLSNAASFGLSLARLADGTLIDLELSALESENQGEVVANPRLVTSNQKSAYVKAGTEIPYQAAGGLGVAQVEFKEAILGLTVTPQITPEGSIILDLLIQQDSIGDIVPGGVAINTQELQTQVLAVNGETIVLGGIYITRKNKSLDKVPFFGDIPGIGYLFRHEYDSIDKQEWLIFITPKVINESLRK
jgi:type IV pilus assembly protein PilQ